MVRLITHNLLACPAKGCPESSNNFPLHFQKDAQLVLREVDFHPAFVRNQLSRLDWDALRRTVTALGDTTELPEVCPKPEELGDGDEVLRKVHHVLLEISVDEGAMVCPNCGHVFAIKQGIPNMILAPHETA